MWIYLDDLNFLNIRMMFLWPTLLNLALWGVQHPDQRCQWIHAGRSVPIGGLADLGHQWSSGCLLISLLGCQFQLQGERNIKKLFTKKFHEPFLSIFDFTPATWWHDVRVPEKPSATLHWFHPVAARCTTRFAPWVAPWSPMQWSLGAVQWKPHSACTWRTRKAGTGVQPWMVGRSYRRVL